MCITKEVRIKANVDLSGSASECQPQATDRFVVW